MEHGIHMVICAKDYSRIVSGVILIISHCLDNEHILHICLKVHPDIYLNIIEASLVSLILQISILHKGASVKGSYLIGVLLRISCIILDYKFYLLILIYRSDGIPEKCCIHITGISMHDIYVLISVIYIY